MIKKTLLTFAAVGVLSGGLVAASTAFAQTTSPEQNSLPTLVQEIANKFHLNASDVQSVFDQHLQEVQAKREANYEKYLANLVKEGKITQAQEQLLITKHKELITQFENDKKNFKSMTPAERRTQLQSTRQDLQNWAQQNNIPLQYLRPFGYGLRRFGMHLQIKPTP